MSDVAGTTTVPAMSRPTDGHGVRYAAFLRGIGPGNPNMANARLRAVFEGLGHDDVGSLLTSGNIVFAASPSSLSSSARAQLEADIQAALRAELGIDGLTIVRDAEDLAGFVARAPFGSLEHSPQTYLLATFLKHARSDVPSALPAVADGAGFRVVGFDAEAQVLCTVTETPAAASRTMSWLERHLGREITSRTWLTVSRAATRLTPR
jgi:uncharacterized protein (DUF1697 family)